MLNSNQPIFQDLKATIKVGNLPKVHSLLQDWRSDSSIPGPTPSDIDALIPRAAEVVGQPAILEYLLSQGGSSDFDTYTVNNTQSPQIFEIFFKTGWKVHNGLLYSHVEYPAMVALFLARGADANPPSCADTNPPTSREYHPLDTAALRAPLESVKILLSHGARIGPKSRAMNAAARGDVPDRIPIMSLLLEHGADINAIAEDYPAMSEARRSGRKGTPLHSAAKWGNKEATVWLLEHGADANVRNGVGETAEEWGKRFERDGTESLVRLRRDTFRKHQREKEKEEEEKKEREKEKKEKEQEEKKGKAEFAEEVSGYNIEINSMTIRA